MTVYFAWVDLVDGAAPAFSAAHHVQDEDIFAFTVTHSEGDFPQLSLEVKNEGNGLLAPGRKRWGWLSRDTGAGAEPLFFGRLVGTPEDVDSETQRLLLIARSKNWAAQKEALADTLRVLPFFDPVWLGENVRNDPDMVLQARSALWHTDRITNALTVSDYVTGEVGPVELNHFRDGLQYRFATAAARQIKVTADALWAQQGQGVIDISASLLKAFTAAGSKYAGLISTYTGEGLIRSWPEVGTRIGSGWSVGPIELTRVDGSLVKREYLEIRTDDGGAGRFPVWEIQPSMKVEYETSRSYGERVSFTLKSDIQPLVVGEDDDEPLELNLSTSAVGEPIDGVLPIGDLRRRSYFQTDRGAQSLSHLLQRARAALRAEARAVEIVVDVPFAEAAALSCRHSATVTDPRLPGGTATGKVTEYSFGIDGETGRAFGVVSLGCTIGTGAELDVPAGDPVYVADDYANGWQADTVAVADEGDTAWQWGAEREVNDDGVDLFQLSEASAVLSVTVENGVTGQRAAMDRAFEDIAEAASQMNAVPTLVTLQMLPIDGTGFSTEYDITTFNLVLPKTIDLEAA